MEIWYQDKNITDSVLPRSCIHRDVSHGRADTLDISFRRAASWNRWEPEIDDKIRVIEDKYDTGILYVNSFVPEADRFRIIATSTPSKVERRAWDCYSKLTLSEIIHRCAVECGMGSGLYGVDGGFRYPFLIRENEGCAAFLERLCRMEGIALKAWSGKYKAIGIEYAQYLDPVRSWTVVAEQDGVRYQHQPRKKLSSLTVRSPWAEATARDSAAKNGSQLVISTLPAMDNAQAGRWARGLLLYNNRRADVLTITTKLEPRSTAMARANIDGNTEANGEWLIEEAEHDLYNGTTITKLMRCVTTIR